jgi:ACS family hexuronate transporter-like MFS transporter
VTQRYRWWILTLLTIATTINYLDRIALGFLAQPIRAELGLDDRGYSQVVGAFQAAYTIGFLIMGKFIDLYGVRIGYSFAALWWGLASMLHTAARAPLQLGLFRALLGLGESGNFPSAIKAVAEWFPLKDRAFATGIFNAGTNMANIIGPLMFAWIFKYYGWRACFYVTSSLGLAFSVVWFFTYYTPRTVDSAGVEIPKEPPMPWLDALRYKQTWGFAAAKFFSDPVWWFYLFWLPIYMFDVRGWSRDEVKWALPFIYFIADLGSVAGGWLSGFFLRRGWPVARARKTAMLICALCPPVAACGVLAPNPVIAVLLFSLATAAHQGWSANLFTTTSDVFPKRAVASVTGIGGAAGGVAGVLFSALIPGYVVPWLGYKPLFLGMGCFYLIGLFALHKLMGDMKPIED